jgi:tetratricopeptide (TPR) repeat protein
MSADTPRQRSSSGRLAREREALLPVASGKDAPGSREPSSVHSLASSPHSSPRPTPYTLHPTRCLVGRETELTQLHGWLEKALSGERQIVFLSGEPGIGKSALVDTFLADLRDRDDIRRTHGQCVEQYGTGEAYLPLLEATTRLCRVPGGKRRIEALRRYAPSWLAQLPGLVEPHDQEHLPQPLQGTSRERMLREMAETAELFTVRRGLVLVLEDLQWSDRSTLDWLVYMARRREPAKLLIIGTYRLGDVLASGHPLRGVVQELRARGQCEEVQVTPLAEAAIAAYLAGRFGEAALPAELPQTIYRCTGGNALFVVNLVNYLVQQGALRQEVGRWTLRAEKSQDPGEGVPNTIRQLIERQLDRWSEGEQQVLEVASVAGVEFAVAEVVVGLQTELGAVEEHCERLARTGQWMRAEGVAEWPDGTLSGRYSFLHALYHAVVYERVAEARRVQLHRRIAGRKATAYGARVGEIASELAMHFELGREYQQAVQYHRQAGETAVRRYAHQEAIGHFTNALALHKQLPDASRHPQHELVLQTALGASWMAIKGYAAPEAEAAYARAYELGQQGDQTPERFFVLFGLGTFYLARAQYPTARDLLEQCLRLAQHLQHPSLILEAQRGLGVLYYMLGDFPQAHALLEQYLASSDPDAVSVSEKLSGFGRVQDPRVYSLAFLAWVLWYRGYPDQALTKSAEAITLAEQLSHPFSLSLALAWTGVLHLLRRETLPAQARSERVQTLAQDQGFALYLAVGKFVHGWILVEQHREEDGIVQMRHGLAAMQAMGIAMGRTGLLAHLAEAYGKTGHV